MTDTVRSITLPKGFQAAGGCFGIKQSGSPDMALIVADADCAAAAVTTRSTAAAAPILISREHVADGCCRAIIVNSGNANAATGAQGLADARTMAQWVGEQLGCNADQVLVNSTGVIGHTLPMDKIRKGVNTLAGQLQAGARADADAATAIMTTDLRPKHAMGVFHLDGVPIHVGGIAKGSGMIAPNMGTMLGYITTDLPVTAPLVNQALTEAVNADASFNRISVDSDTSTSDMVAVLASGMAPVSPVTSVDSHGYRLLVEALTHVCRDLAWQIIRDGEGVNHVIDVQVTGAVDNDQALTFARSIADSPLVKTAVHGLDPNWGRIVMALGKTTLPLPLEQLVVSICDTVVFAEGRPTGFDAPMLSSAMDIERVPIRVDLHQGRGGCRFLGCDLSREYIAINADYHT